MPKPCQPQKPRCDEPVSKPDMQPVELTDLIMKFKEGLQAERAYIANYLEKYHACLLASCSEACATGLPAVPPDIGPSGEFRASCGRFENPEDVCSQLLADKGENVIRNRASILTLSCTTQSRGISRQPRRTTTLSAGSQSQQTRHSTESSDTGCKNVQIQRRLHARLGFFRDTDLVTADTIHAAVEAISLEDFCLFEIKLLVSHLRAAFSDQMLSTESGRIKYKKASSVQTQLESISSQIEFSLPFGWLVQILPKDEDEMMEVLGHDKQDLWIRVRDVLLSSDDNCIVAEMLNLRADEVAQKRPNCLKDQVMEPFFALAIVLNCALIGFKTYPNIENATGMFAVEVVFTSVFTVELFFRMWLCETLCKYVCGTVGILRLFRFSKIIRIIKMVRLEFFSDITLMVQGLFAGARTLFWAVVLLLFFIYAFSIVLTLTVGQDARHDDFDADRRESFSTLPRAAFTMFRCTVVVDCASSVGSSLLLSASQRYGSTTYVAYTFLFLIVNIGLMNLIMAVFVEKTMRQAQQAAEHERILNNRDSHRVAHKLKELLLRFSHAAYGRKTLGTVVHSVEIAREDFMIALQDERLQVLMDELDIPPERAQLFDVLDTDADGIIHAEEILDGLLKIRGEFRRTDTMASLLAIRALQNQVRGIKSIISDNYMSIVTAITNMEISRCS